MFIDESAFFETALFQATGMNVLVESMQFVPGGSINNTAKLTTSEGVFFIKWSESGPDDLFEKEAAGLELLQKHSPLRTPAVIGFGRADMKNYLLLEYLPKQAPRGDFWELLGQRLALQHQQTHTLYGLPYGNHIGRLPQKNEQKAVWIDFFIEHRLEVQLGLAIYNELVDAEFARKFRTLYPQLPGLLPNEPASLLHGDLWSGNFLVGPGGEPYLVDPAVYYGSREMELAFTDLFGGFDRLFYLSYHENWPLEAGFRERIPIYNLYPLLVHVNLFGKSYLSGIEKTIRQFT